MWRWIAIAVAAVWLLGVGGPTLPPQLNELSAASAGTDLLPVDLRDDVLLADAMAHRETPFAPYPAPVGSLEILIATEPDQLSNVAAALQRMGGMIQFRDDDVQYLRAFVPVERWPSIRQLQGVAAVAINGASYVLPVDLGLLSHEPSLEATRQEERQLPPPVPTRPTYSQIALGLDRFWSTYPQFDGRGVVVAFIEGSSAGLPLDHPAFQPAKTLEGQPASKIADAIVVNAPLRLIEPRWSFSSTEDSIRGPDRLYRLPKAGTFHWSRIEEPRIGTATVLWDPVARSVWVDSDGDGDFREEPVLRDVREAPATGRIGEGRRFRLTMAEDGRRLTLHPASGAHAMMTASVIAGSSESANLAMGLAPNARLIPIDPLNLGRESVSPANFLEGVIAAARRPDVDIISSSTTVVAPHPFGESQVAPIVMARAARQFGKLLVQAAGNAYGTETSLSPGSAALTVGAYLPALTATRYYRMPVGSRGRVHGYSSRGPLNDGGMGPELIGPANQVAAAPCEEPERVGNRFFGLSSCYSMSGGTSAAAPAVAGLSAVLLSAAKQENVPVDAERLRWALRSSAILQKDLTIAEQGLGLPQADVAWRLLKNAPALPRIEGRAPLAHVLDSYRTDGATGRGLYEREGWTVGQHRVRHVQFRRGDGPDRPLRYRIRLLGNSGVFSVPDAVRLAFNEWTTVPIEVTARTPGVHSALLDLQDPEGRFSVFQMPLTIIVGDVLKAGMALRYGGDLPPFEQRTHAVVVPPGLEALHVQIERRDDLTVLMFEPAGWSYHRSNVAKELRRVVARSGKESLLLPQPDPGTWLFMAARAATPKGTLPSDPSSYRVTVEGVRATGQPVATSLETRVDFQLTAASGDSLRVTPRLASISTSRSALSQQGLPVVIPLVLERPVELLLWRMRSEASTARFHAYAYDCTSGSCIRSDALTPAVADGQISIRQPRQGLWKLVLTPGPRMPQTDVAVELFLAESDAPPLSVSAARSSSPAERSYTVALDCNRLPAPRSALLFELSSAIDNAPAVAPQPARPDPSASPSIELAPPDVATIASVVPLPVCRKTTPTTAAGANRGGGV